MNIKAPKYTLIDGIKICLAMSTRAYEAISALGSRVDEFANRLTVAERQGLSDVDFEYDGERSICLVIGKGPDAKKVPIRIPIPIYRDVYSKDANYERGDMVTWGGSLWVAKQDTADEPGPLSGAWQMAAKRGRKGSPGGKE
jgi:hypothetical protein